MRIVSANLTTAFIAFALATTACDPGDQCDPNAGDFPEGVDPCDPATYPTPDVGADLGGDVRADAAESDYPTAGIGTQEGDVIADFTLPTVPTGDFSLSRDIYSNEDAKLLLISTAAGWCGACREEQPALSALDDAHADDGLRVIVAVFEDNNAAPATAAFADGWRQQYGLSVPVLLDERNDLSAYYDPGLAPMNLFVDGETMEILAVTIGSLDMTVANALIADRL